MSGPLAGRAALVTGGTGALGHAVVSRFLAAGATVHATWVDDREVASFQKALGNAADAVTLHRADVTSEPEVRGLFDAIGSVAPVGILANIVGGFAHAALGETEPAIWDRMISLNATSAFLCCRAAVPAMRAARWGRIVNVAAVPAVGGGAANMSAYAAAKAAVLNLTLSLAKELVADGITVNAIVPSTIDTPANRSAMPDADRSTWLSAEAIGDVVVLLGSEQAGIVTGTAVNLATA